MIFPILFVWLVPIALVFVLLGIDDPPSWCVVVTWLLSVFIVAGWLTPSDPAPVDATMSTLPH